MTVPGLTVHTVAKPVLYLDVDGTVRKGKDDLDHFVNGPEDVEVFPVARERIWEWRKRTGGRVALVTNQGGVALGHLSLHDMMAAMHETVAQLGEEAVDKVAICIHHPKALDPEMARCWCRKPSPGAVVEAAYSLSDVYPGEHYPPHLALMVGDMRTDRECAEGANVDFMWAHRWREDGYERLAEV